LRTILARYTRIDPRDLAFSSGLHGKPHLNQSDLHFNLSHSEHIALLAVTRDTEVGIDIEHIDPRRTTEDIAARYFSPAEQTELANYPGEERRPAFFRCWSRKEAVIKALGEGLVCPLDSFDVSLDPHHTRLLALRREHANVTVWSMIAIDAHPDYAAAAALIGPCDHTAGYTFTPE
jgi:4'-phosphopantetheinyl transferase